MENNMKRNNIVFLFVFMIVAIVGGVFYIQKTSAAAIPVIGWAWGEAFIDSNGNGTFESGESEQGGIGHISLSSTDCYSEAGVFKPSDDERYAGCPTSGVAHPYGVSLSSGNLTGYAWSDTYGWIKFGGLSGFPAGSATYAGNARVNNNRTRSDPTDDFVEGWIRVCSVFVSANCTGVIKAEPALGGWDGWISLRGKTGKGNDLYGLNVSTGRGYAWGSNLVGWMEWTLSLDGTPVDIPEPGVCAAAEKTCTSSGPMDDTPADTPVGTAKWICRGQYGGADSGTCSACQAGYSLVAGVCTLTVPPPVPISNLTYNLVPKMTAVDTGTCELSNWQVAAGSLPITCTLDTPAPNTAIPYPALGATRDLNVGTYTLSCSNSVNTLTVRPQCRLNPNYGEF